MLPRTLRMSSSRSWRTRKPTAGEEFSIFTLPWRSIANGRPMFLCTSLDTTSLDWPMSTTAPRCSDLKTYGGGGIFNLYATVAIDSEWAPYVFVHEFGHHFAGLADEYYTSEVSYVPATRSEERRVGKE